MEEKKHFKYEGNVHLEPQKPDNVEKVEIKDIRFLMPIRVDLKVEEKVVPVFANIDLTNKEVYFDCSWLNNAIINEKVFEHLRVKTTLPEDKYEADENIYDEVERAHAEYDQLREDNIKGKS